MAVLFDREERLRFSCVCLRLCSLKTVLVFILMRERLDGVPYVKNQVEKFFKSFALYPSPVIATYFDASKIINWF